MQTYSLPQRLGAEFLGTAFLLATVVGSGIMSESLAGGNIAIALLGNTIPTGAILVVLITMLGPVSGAHFNPAVTFAFYLRGDIAASGAVAFVAVQIVAGFIGVLAAHAMFDLAVIQVSEKLRTGPAQWFSEWVATFGLVVTILLTLRARSSSVPMAVGLYITSAYWFTASTSFANPAVTIARGFSNTFAGISPEHVPAFIAAQLVGAAAAVIVAALLTAGHHQRAAAEPAE
ncbi:MAG: aquaporin family protein [Alphaproteobacteria bacterium]|nr:aquaporin family protein [Alphaproteobacteria bacterium]